MDFAVGLSCILLLVFLFMKMPVFVAILGAASTYFILHPELKSVVFAQRFISGSQNMALLAIPFFVCAGVFMNYTGVTKRIIDFCEALVGNVVGGIGHVTVLVATLMGGLSGSNLADAAMEAKMLVPEMERRGFSRAFGSVLVATSAIITPLIPPGIAMIVYGSIANVSIGKLFVDGIGHVTVLVATLMGGLSGSNLADAAMEAKMLVPEMERRGFSRAFGSVLVATSAIITPLIPPGIAMIVYGSIANVSIGKLFVDGIGPGLMLCIALMLLVSLVSYKRNYRSSVKVDTSFKRVVKTFKGAFLPLCLPVIIIGGIRIGAFTPTEAGSVAIVYSLLLGLIYREMTFKNVLDGLKETVLTSGAIMLIVASASAFAWVLTKESVPQFFTNLFINYMDDKILFLLCVNIFLLIIGMFIEGNAAMIILVPLLVPLAKHFGIDEIHFAMVVIFNFALGALSPPMGTLMFVTCSITKVTMGNFIKEAMPFYVLLVACLLLLTFFPVLSTGLVSLVY